MKIETLPPSHIVGAYCSRCKSFSRVGLEIGSPVFLFSGGDISPENKSKILPGASFQLVPELFDNFLCLQCINNLCNEQPTTQP